MFVGIWLVTFFRYKYLLIRVQRCDFGNWLDGLCNGGGIGQTVASWKWKTGWMDEWWWCLCCCVGTWHDWLSGWMNDGVCVAVCAHGIWLTVWVDGWMMVFVLLCVRMAYGWLCEWMDEWWCLCCCVCAWHMADRVSGCMNDGVCVAVCAHDVTDCVLQGCVQWKMEHGVRGSPCGCVGQAWKGLLWALWDLGALVQQLLAVSSHLLSNVSYTQAVPSALKPKKLGLSYCLWTMFWPHPTLSWPALLWRQRPKRCSTWTCSRRWRRRLCLSTRVVEEWWSRMTSTRPWCPVRLVRLVWTWRHRNLYPPPVLCWRWTTVWCCHTLAVPHTLPEGQCRNWPPATFWLPWTIGPCLVRSVTARRCVGGMGCATCLICWICHTCIRVLTCITHVSELWDVTCVRVVGCVTCVWIVGCVMCVWVVGCVTCVSGLWDVPHVSEFWDVSHDSQGCRTTPKNKTSNPCTFPVCLDLLSLPPCKKATITAANKKNKKRRRRKKAIYTGAASCYFVAVLNWSAHAKVVFVVIILSL